MTVQADGGGLRHPDPDKLARFDLLPPEPLQALAFCMGNNLEKYPSRNWERGMKWGHCFGAIMRHAWKFWRGESYDVDPKTGVRTHHMIAVMWNAMALFTYEARGIGEDDRAVPQAAILGAALRAQERALSPSRGSVDMEADALPAAVASGHAMSAFVRGFYHE